MEKKLEVEYSSKSDHAMDQDKPPSYCADSPPYYKFSPAKTKWSHSSGKFSFFLIAMSSAATVVLVFMFFIWFKEVPETLKEQEMEIERLTQKLQEQEKAFEKIVHQDGQARRMEKPDCSLSMDIGFCRAAMPKWYFDTRMSECKMFTYGGCGGNSNNFGTFEDCWETCGNKQNMIFPENFADETGPSTDDATVCQLEPEAGVCRAALIRWYYDPLDQTCKTFIYGGCSGNGNNFENESKCQQKCGGVKPQNVPVRIADSVSDLYPELEDDVVADKCNSSPAMGPCRGAFIRFFYDNNTNECKDFIYGGCDGNKNNFEEKEDCERECKKI